MATHYYANVSVRFNADTIKAGTTIFARVSSDGTNPWQSWGATKPATVPAKTDTKIILPSLVYGSTVGSLDLHVSLHIARLNGNPAVESWDLGSGICKAVRSGPNSTTIKNSAGAEVAVVCITTKTYTASYSASSKIEQEFVSVEAMAVELDRMDSGIGAKSDPYFVVRTTFPGDVEVILFKSHYQRKTLTPNWGTILLPKIALGGLDDTQPLTVEVWDWDKDSEKGGDDLIGTFTTTTADIMANKTCLVINSDKKEKKKGYEHSGKFLFVDARIVTCDADMYSTSVVTDNLKIRVNVVAAMGVPDKSKEENLYTLKESLNCVYDYIKDYQASSGKTRLYGIYPSGLSPMKRIPDANTHFGEIGGKYLDDEFEKANKSVTGAPLTKLADVITECTSIAMDGAEVKGAYNIFVIYVYDNITDIDECMLRLANSGNFACSYIFLGVGLNTKCNWKNLEQLNAYSFGFASAERWAIRENTSFMPLSGGTYGLTNAVLTSHLVTQFGEWVRYKHMRDAGLKPGFRPLLK